jgi:hypothetical protein
MGITHEVSSAMMNFKKYRRALRHLLDRLVMPILCKLSGHDYKEARQYFLPSRECSRCGNRQVKIPDVAPNPGWHDAV